MNKHIFGFLILGALSLTRTFADDMTNKASTAITGLAETSIKIKDNEKEIKTNQPVVVIVSIKNVSTNETLYFFQLLAAETDPGLAITVISPSGKNIPLKTAIAPHGSGHNVSLRPNQVYEFEIELSRLCKFNEIGTYKIVAKKEVETSEGRLFWVDSNVLNLPMVPGKWGGKTNAPAGF